MTNKPPLCTDCNEHHPPIQGCGGSYPEKECITIAAEDGKDGVECLVCDEEYGDHWTLVGSYGDAWGGTGVHDCPQDGCPGRIYVMY